MQLAVTITYRRTIELTGTDTATVNATTTIVPQAPNQHVQPLALPSGQQELSTGDSPTMRT